MQAYSHSYILIIHNLVSLSDSKWKEVNVLVTGGASFIGSHLVDKLVQYGSTVTVVDDLSSGKKDNLTQSWNKINFPYSYKILVVNDGSTDNTEEIARSKGAMVINHVYNLGIGSSTKTGLLASRLFKPEIVINIDADGQHDPKYIPEIVSKIKNENTDLVIASRFADESDYKTTIVRSVGNRFYTRLVNQIAKISITDVTSGYRGIKFDKLNSIFFIAETNFAIESTIRAGKNGLKIMEIPVISKSRKYGESQFHRIENFLVYNWNALVQIFNALNRKADMD